MARRASLAVALLAIGASNFCLSAATATEVLVSSRDSSEIYKFDLTTGASTAFITGGASGLSGPVGMRYGPDGNLYVSNFFNNEIRKYNGATGASMGVFISAKAGLNNPSDLRFGPDGNLYVANFGGTTIARFDGQTGAPLPADAGKAFASGGDLSQPTSIRFEGNQLYVSNFGSDAILTYDITQPVPAPAILFADAALLSTEFGFGAAGTAFHNGDLYVAGLLGQTIGMFDSKGQATGQFYTPENLFPSDLLFTPDGKLLVSSAGLNGVFAFDPETGTQIVPNPNTNPFGMYLYNPGILIAGQLLFVAIPGDATEDAIVDGADYTVWANHFLLTTKLGAMGGDFNFDGKVDAGDYTIWANNFQPVVPLLSAVAVPEPATMVLLLWGLIGIVGFGRWRSRTVAK